MFIVVRRNIQAKHTCTSRGPVILGMGMGMMGTGMGMGMGGLPSYKRLTNNKFLESVLHILLNGFHPHNEFLVGEKHELSKLHYAHAHAHAHADAIGAKNL